MSSRQILSANRHPEFGHADDPKDDVFTVNFEFPKPGGSFHVTRRLLEDIVDDFRAVLAE